MHGFETKLPLKRPHDNWMTRIKGADPRSNRISLEQQLTQAPCPALHAPHSHLHVHTQAGCAGRQAGRQAKQEGYAVTQELWFRLLLLLLLPSSCARLYRNLQHNRFLCLFEKLKLLVTKRFSRTASNLRW